jgi:hypothetical protein
MSTALEDKISNFQVGMFEFQKTLYEFQKRLSLKRVKLCTRHEGERETEDTEA